MVGLLGVIPNSSDSAVRNVDCTLRWSHDEISALVETEIVQLRKTVAEKEVSSSHSSISDSMLLYRVASSSRFNKEMTERRRSVPQPWRWTDRMESDAARSWSASRRGPSKGMGFMSPE